MGRREYLILARLLHSTIIALSCVSCSAPVAVTSFRSSHTAAGNSKDYCKDNFENIDVLGSLPQAGTYVEVGYIKTEQWSNSELFFSSDNAQIEAARIEACVLGADAIVMLGGTSDVNTYWGPLVGLQYKDERANRIVAIRYSAAKVDQAPSNTGQSQPMASSSGIGPTNLEGFWDIKWGTSKLQVWKVMTIERKFKQIEGHPVAPCENVTLDSCAQFSCSGNYGGCDSMKITSVFSSRDALMAVKLESSWIDSLRSVSRFDFYQRFISSYHGSPVSLFADSCAWLFENGGRITATLTKSGDDWHLESWFFSPVADSIRSTIQRMKGDPPFRRYFWGDSITVVRRLEHQASIDSMTDMGLYCRDRLADHHCAIVYRSVTGLLRLGVYEFDGASDALSPMTIEFERLLSHKYGPQLKEWDFSRSRLTEFALTGKVDGDLPRAQYLGTWADIRSVVIMVTLNARLLLVYCDRTWLKSSPSLTERPAIDDL